MEIKEILTFYINEDTKSVEVEFRLLADLDNQLRTDVIEFEIIDEYGYGEYIESNSFDSDDDDYYSEVSEDEFKITKSELKRFLSDYYSDNKKRIPKPDLI